jgi:hypothetical protein
MVNLSIAVPEELKRRMDAHDTVNWSAVARHAFEERIRDMEFIQQFTKHSTMTEKDAVRLGRELKKRAEKRIRTK